MMNTITMVPTVYLRHHPKNPRQDLGDLTELKESIEKQGILQNLTIVKDEEYDPDPGMPKERYWVLIGNRRFEAAQKAGLKELPCAIVEMDEKEQIATMLCENMQRADLTVYEQAQGFQLMMDLGYTKKEISEKTGFGKTTVENRLKLAKMNPKKLKDAVQKGATLLDLLEVTKLDGKREQNEILNEAGTANFREKLLRAINDQEYEKNKARLIPILEEMGLKEQPSGEMYSDKWQNLQNDGFEMQESEEQLRKHIRKIMKEEGKRYCYKCIQYYGGNQRILFYVERQRTQQESDQQKSLRSEAIARGKHLRYVKSFWARAYDLRKDFVKNFVMPDGLTSAGLMAMIAKYSLKQCTEWRGELRESHNWDGKYIREVLSLPETPVKKSDNSRYDWISIWEHARGKNIPAMKMIVAWAVAGGVFCADKPEHGLYDFYDGEYQENSNQNNDVKEMYEFLMEIGYELSDMERLLLNGKHECYKKEAKE